jgi:hypothetical protein
MGGMPAGHIARWGGQSWQVLPGGGLDGNVYALTVHDDGSGPAPVTQVAGSRHAGASAAANLAKYRGAAWRRGRGRSGWCGAGAASVDRDGSEARTAGSGGWGESQHAGSVAASRVAMWDGQGFQAMDGGTDGKVLALAGFSHSGEGGGAGVGIFAGGSFTHAGGRASPFIGEFGCAACYANCDGSTAAPILNVKRLHLLPQPVHGDGGVRQLRRKHILALAQRERLCVLHEPICGRVPVKLGAR